MALSRFDRILGGALGLGSLAILLAWGAAARLGRPAQAAALPSGRALYLSNGCAACHGVDGDGKGMVGRGFNPPPTDFRDAASYRQGRDLDSLRQAIREGIQEDDSRMPAFAHLSQPELNALAGYLTSLQAAANRPEGSR